MSKRYKNDKLIKNIKMDIYLSNIEFRVNSFYVFNIKVLSIFNISFFCSFYCFLDRAVLSELYDVHDKV